MISLLNKDITMLKRLGYGCCGEAYALGDNVLKVTRHEREYAAALRLLGEPRPWAARIFAAEVAGPCEWRILKERVRLIDFKEPGSPGPGHFIGLPFHEGSFADRASSPLEFCQGLMPTCNMKACEVRPLNAVERSQLAARYLHPEQQRCFHWFLDTFQDMRSAGFATLDLYCNIAYRANGEFVNFDVMTNDEYGRF